MSGIVGTSHSKSKVIGRSQDTAKAWVYWDGHANGSHSIIASYNVSSVGDQATGVSRITFTVPFNSVNYVPTGFGYNDGGGNSSVLSVNSSCAAPAAGYIDISQHNNAEATASDGNHQYSAFFGE